MKKIILLTITLLLTSCASETKKEIQIEKEEVVLSKSHRSILERAHRDILDSPDLDPETKDDFLALQYETQEKVKEVNTELRKIKVVFFKSLTEKDHNERKSNELIRQMKKLHNKKLDIMIKSFYEAKNILGHEVFTDNKDMLWIDQYDPSVRF